MLSANMPDAFADEVSPLCANLLGENPRALKQFINRFVLEQEFIKEKLGEDYNPYYHCFCHLLQERFPDAYALLHKLNGEGMLVSPTSSRQQGHPLYSFLAKWESDAKRKIIWNELVRYYDYLPPQVTSSTPCPLDGKFVTVRLLEQPSTIGIVLIPCYTQNQKILPNSNLSDMSDMSGTFLRNLNFSYAELDRTDFTGADIKGAFFQHADLTGSTFTRANLIGCDFSSACIKQCVFEGAELEGAVFDEDKAPSTVR